jgi:hypothetical protein
MTVEDTFAKLVGRQASEAERKTYMSHRFESPKFDAVHMIVGVTLGPVALFDADQICYRRRNRVFVFRTLQVDDRLAASVPGVKPHVQLLLQVHSSGRDRLIRELFAYLARTCREPSSMPDDFYVRVGAVLGGRLPGPKVVRSLLPPWCAAGDLWTP